MIWSNWNQIFLAEQTSSPSFLTNKKGDPVCKTKKGRRMQVKEIGAFLTSVQTQRSHTNHRQMSESSRHHPELGRNGNAAPSMTHLLLHKPR
jgi:hypothetical protein